MSAGQRRLFFALWPDDELRHALFHWQTRNLPADVDWTHRDDLHLTLHFLGAVEPDRVEGLRRLGGGLGPRRLTLALDTIGHWPRPRVLWAGPSRVPAALRALHRDLATGLQALGFAIETRPYRPHVTLARKVPAQAAGWPGIGPLGWVPGEIALLESRPGSAPHYHPLARWPMA